MKSEEKKEKSLDRAELYKRLLKRVKMRPASKSPARLAYFTTDHLRALYALIEGADKCRSSKTH